MRSTTIVAWLLQPCEVKLPGEHKVTPCSSALDVDVCLYLDPFIPQHWNLSQNLSSSCSLKPHRHYWPALREVATALSPLWSWMGMSSNTHKWCGNTYLKTQSDIDFKGIRDSKTVSHVVGGLDWSLGSYTPRCSIITHSVGTAWRPKVLAPNLWGSEIAGTLPQQ